MRKEWYALLIPPAIAAIVGGISSAQFIEWMATTGGIATLVPILVEFIKKRAKITGKTWKIYIPFTRKYLFKAKAARFVTWGLSIILIMLSYHIGWGFQSIGLLALTWNVLIAGFLANEYYKVEKVQLWLAKVSDNMDKVKKLIELIENNKE